MQNIIISYAIGIKIHICLINKQNFAKKTSFTFFVSPKIKYVNAEYM